MDDAGEVNRLADIVRDNGWDVCFGRSGEPGALDADAHADVLDRAACVLAVWSSNAAQTALVRSDVLDGHQRAKLLLACLDDAAPPVSGIDRLGLQRWCGDGDVRDIQVLVDKLVVMAGSGGRRRGRVVPHAPPHRFPRLAAYGVTAAAASAATLAICLAWVALNPWNAERGPIANKSLAMAGDLPAASANDPDAKTSSLGIRPRTGSNVVAGQSAPPTDVDWLERAAWQDIQSNRDIPAQLEAIANYMIDYPSGVFADEARVLEAQQRGMWRRIQNELIEKGFLASVETSSIPRTRAAAERYERSLGLAPSEVLTASLLTALEAGKFDVPKVEER